MAGSDEDMHDAYLEQMKAEGAERDEDDSDSSEGGNALRCDFITADGVIGLTMMTTTLRF